jgi:cell fate (sporulation/competence/biofilm development) regulator YlbF (YheA/YmcA/DUF963 family)
MLEPPINLTGKYTMPFTEEIRQAAENLGKYLGADPIVIEYVSLKGKMQQDAEVVDLENKLAQLYQNLAERQQNGESLERSELDEYYNLKRQVQGHPLIVARDYQLELVKATFAEAGQRMTSILGIEYTTFAT